MIRFDVFRKAQREWPDELAAAPFELQELIEDAMIDFGPDGHCDGADKIAALVLDWMRNIGYRAIVDTRQD